MNFKEIGVTYLQVYWFLWLICLRLTCKHYVLIRFCSVVSRVSVFSFKRKERKKGRVLNG